jgi:hypothetical protein
MGAPELVIALSILASSLGQTQQSEIKHQEEVYQRRWGTDLELRFDELPAKGTVEAHRVPYSGYIYPDTHGGTVKALAKYDRAFSRGRGRAASYERWDTSSGAEATRRVESYGPFGRRTEVFYSRQIPYWHGHCNGWTAAAIRHPEPERNVTINRVTFTPKDVKALLAEIYIYSDIDYLAGEYGLVKPHMLHITLANWLGREKYPIAMEATPGKEKWNYPIYGFATTSAHRGERRVEVKLNIAFSNYSNQELDKSPRLKLIKYFHYMLNLNSTGEIVGGYYYRDSAQIDLLWAPLSPIAGGQPGNERGNPYVNIDRVLDLCQQSASQDLVTKWFNDRSQPDEVELADHVEASPSDLSENEPSPSSDETASGEPGSTEPVAGEPVLGAEVE